MSMLLPLILSFFLYFSGIWKSCLTFFQHFFKNSSKKEKEKSKINKTVKCATIFDNMKPAVLELNT